MELLLLFFHKKDRKGFFLSVFFLLSSYTKYVGLNIVIAPSLLRKYGIFVRLEYA